MSYNMTFMNSSNTLLDIYQGVNVETTGLISILFLAALYIILIASISRYDNEKTFIISSFITSVVAILMFFLGVVVWWVVMLFIMLFLITLIVHFFNN